MTPQEIEMWLQRLQALPQQQAQQQPGMPPQMPGAAPMPQGAAPQPMPGGPGMPMPQQAPQQGAPYGGGLTDRALFEMATRAQR